MDNRLENKSNGMAITSMVLGILSLPLCCAFGIGGIFGILGLIFGSISIKNDNKGMALTGIITSIISLVMLLLVVFVYILIPSTNI